MPPKIQTHTPGVNYIIGYMPPPIRQRTPKRSFRTEAGRDVADPADTTSLTPRSSTHPSAAPTAAPYRATPTYGAAGFSAKGTA